MPGEVYVDRVKETIAETEILYHADMMEEAMDPKEVLDCFRVRAERIEFNEGDINRAVDRLVGDGHLRKTGNKVEITEDGKDDVRRTKELIENFGKEIGKGVVCPGGREQKTA